jgi:hypothetical protein
MSVNKPPPSRTGMSAQERQVRSRLTQMVTARGLIRGTLLQRERSCGNPRCRCASGQKHRALYLMLREDGKLRQLYIPAAYETRVREWVANHQQFKQLLRQLSDLHWEQVKQRQG